jgi:transcriptional regulator with XRE-family HTH domain
MKPHPLKVEREQRGWSQARVAEALGVSTLTVIRWEQRRAIPYPYYREQLAQLFGKSVPELDLLPPEQQPELPQEPAVALATDGPSTIPTPPPMLLDPAIPLLLGRTGSLVGRAALLYCIAGSPLDILAKLSHENRLAWPRATCDDHARIRR